MIFTSIIVILVFLIIDNIIFAYNHTIKSTKKKKDLQRIWDLLDENNNLNERVELFNHFLYLVCKKCAKAHLTKINISSLNLADYISLYNESLNHFITCDFPLEYGDIDGTTYLFNSILNKEIINKSKYTNDFCKIEYSSRIIDATNQIYDLSLTIKLEIERDE